MNYEKRLFTTATCYWNQSVIFLFAFSKGGGYQIDIKLKDAKTEMLYLQGYYGNSTFIVDSAAGRKDLFRFKSKNRNYIRGSIPC